MGSLPAAKLCAFGRPGCSALLIRPPLIIEPARLIITTPVVAAQGVPAPLAHLHPSATASQLVCRMISAEPSIATWAPYREAVFPRSGDRVLLGEALTTYMLLSYGLGARHIAAAFDGNDHDGTAERVTSAIRLIGGLLLEGRLTAWARPIGGGVPVELEPHHWELDDFTHRFATCALDLRRPYDAGSPPTHRIFIGDEDHRAIFEGCCDDVPKPIVKRRAPSAQPTPMANTVAPPMQTTHAVDRHIRLPEVETLTGMKRSTIYKRMDEGRFPQQISPGSRMASWRESEVAAWLADPR